MKFAVNARKTAIQVIENCNDSEEKVSKNDKKSDVAQRVKKEKISAGVHFGRAFRIYPWRDLRLFDFGNREMGIKEASRASRSALVDGFYDIVECASTL
ncbi:Muscarinic acetylcholine receptor [Dirofilaria immitis]